MAPIPVGPVSPVAPVAPVAPVGPVAPVSPVAPIPVGPVSPVGPVAPVGPLKRILLPSLPKMSPPVGNVKLPSVLKSHDFRSPAAFADNLTALSADVTIISSPLAAISLPWIPINTLDDVGKVIYGPAPFTFSTNS